MSIKSFFHHLFNPHCEQCSKLKECNSCHILREQLDYERRQNQLLIDSIINKPVEHPVTANDFTFEPLNLNKLNSFKEKRKQLEEQDRVQAEKLEKLKSDQSASDEVVKLEEILGVTQ